MDAVDYAVRAAGAWFLGFAPFAEIYVAVPVARASGLDPASVVLWTVAGNYAPVPLIHLLYERLVAIPRVGRWFGRLVSERFAARIERQGTWIVLLVTPWVSVWAVAVTGKVVRLRRRALFGATLLSIALYAVALVALIEAGLQLGGA